MDNLSDREILLLTAKSVQGIEAGLPALHARVARLEHWRTFLAGAWTVASGFLGLAHFGGKHH